jgi:hypothetical protein
MEPGDDGMSDHAIDLGSRLLDPDACTRQMVMTMSAGATSTAETARTPYSFSSVRLVPRGPALTGTERVPGHTQKSSLAAAHPHRAFRVEQNDREVVIRVKLDAASDLDNAQCTPIVITQQNCHLVGLKRRQFLELVRNGTIKGARYPGTKIVAATTDEVLRVVEQAGTAAPANRRDGARGDVEDVLAAVGMQLRKGPH